ncbi:type IV secretion system protein (plasmid) [Roseomonas sp. CCTCC AB2023176]|uniref:type IV secretion system protein n=1 Tax=Roseomonas sp. CCTCC AB2023176 TaxID=3342640 RepID=UPI0035D86979
MNDIQFAIFTYIVSQVERQLVDSVSGVVAAFLTYASAPLRVALVLYVALTGIALVRGGGTQPGSVILARLLRAAAVVWLLTGSGNYELWIHRLFFEVLPTSLSNALTSGGVAPISSASFDQVWLATWRAGLEVWRASGYTEIGKQFCVILFWLAGILSTVFCFAIWLVSRVVLALYIAIGPLLVGLALFAATRSVFERWIGSLISCVILQVTTVVLLFIILAVLQRVVGTVGRMPSSESMSMIQVLLAGMIFFGVSAFVALQLPGIATSLAGGLNFHTGAVARAMRAGIGSTGRSVPSGPSGPSGGGTVRVNRSGMLGVGHAVGSVVGRGAVAGTRAIYTRLRPPTGGSLSDGSRRI